MNKFYKSCAVPQCGNTTIRTPEKLFIHVPRKEEGRKIWLQLARRDSSVVAIQSKMYFCEDHFDLPNDMENYTEYYLMGSVSQIRMKPGCVPTKFKYKLNRTLCTDMRKARKLTANTQRFEATTECEKEIPQTTQSFSMANDDETASSSGSMAGYDVKVCRICFATDSKLYSITSYKVLCKTYETITGLSIEDEHNLPLYVCTECSHQLLNCARFRSRSLRAHLIMIDIVKKQDCITIESIQSVIGQSPLGSSGIHDKTDQCDLDVELLDIENIHNNEQDDVNVPVPKDDDDDGIKSEDFDVIDLDEYIIDDDNMSILLNDIPDDSKDVDDPKVNDPRVLETSNDSRNVTADISNFQNAEDEIKDEKSDEIVLDVINDDAGQDMVKDEDASDEMAGLPGDALNDDVVDTTENIEHSSEVIVPGDTVIGKDRSPGDGDLPSALTSDSTNIIRPQDTAKLLEDLYAKSTCQQSPQALLTEETLCCDMCSYQTVNVVLFLTHLQNHATPVLFNCNKCTFKAESKPQLADHMKGHNDKLYICDVCKSDFAKKIDIRRHMRTHFRLKLNFCTLCKKGFTSKFILRNHIEDKHAGSYSCGVCEKIFVKESKYRKHLLKHTNEREYTCKVCNNSFVSSTSLKIHLRKHYRKSCEFCNKKFVINRNFQKHLRLHTGKDLFACDICKKTFIEKHTMEIHIRTHSTEKTIPCAICDRKFRTEPYLQRHMVVHTKKSNFCNICKRKCYSKDNLITHLEKHANEKPYSCNICKTSFADKATLKRHVKTHKLEGKCDICDERFNDNSELEKHLLVHASDKAYSCDVCQKKFIHKNDLEKHLELHFESSSTNVVLVEDN